MMGKHRNMEVKNEKMEKKWKIKKYPQRDENSRQDSEIEMPESNPNLSPDIQHQYSISQSHGGEEENISAKCEEGSSSMQKTKMGGGLKCGNRLKKKQHEYSEVEKIGVIQRKNNMCLQQGSTKMCSEQVQNHENNSQEKPSHVFSKIPGKTFNQFSESPGKTNGECSDSQALTYVYRVNEKQPEASEVEKGVIDIKTCMFLQILDRKDDTCLPLQGKTTRSCNSTSLQKNGSVNGYRVKTKHPEVAKVGKNGISDEGGGESEAKSKSAEEKELCDQSSEKTKTDGSLENAEFFHANACRRESKEGGISVSVPFPMHDKNLETIGIEESKNGKIFIANHRPATSVILYCVKFPSMNPQGAFVLAEDFPLDLSNVRKCECELKKGNRNVSDPSKALLGSCALIGCPKIIEPGEEISLNLTCKASITGLHQLTILFDFGEEKIEHCIKLMAKDRKKGSSKVGNSKPLKKYRCPPKLRAALSNHGSLDLPSFSATTYIKYFSNLLYAEEFQIEKQVREYGMKNVVLEDSGEFKVLKVPGLLERRPSVTRGDAIFVTQCSSNEKYQGIVSKVEEDRVFLEFEKGFPWINRHVDVQFSVPRANFRHDHQAIDATLHLPQNIIFPNDDYLSPTNNHPPFGHGDQVKGVTSTSISNYTFDSFPPFNKALNEEQRSAIQEILKRSGGPPYLLYGPPGTGKTHTVVEAILQVLRCSPHARILVSAPSNCASDVLLERLINHVSKMDMFRLNGYKREVDKIPYHIQPYTCIKNNSFDCPPREELTKYKVVVSTFRSCSLLVANEIERNHFTHIFLDEAGQATEPETMIPIANFASITTVIVLAGDQHQLGPVIFSHIAETHGLGVSYLERLSNLPLYTKKTSTFMGETVSHFNKSVATKLMRNYRSHPAILVLPSHLFYDGELVAWGPEGSRSSLCDWKLLLHENFPLLFMESVGQEQREEGSHSLFNPKEVAMVIEVVKNLQARRLSPVSNDDIGIISPYAKQVRKLKAALAKEDIKDIKVGCVEEFQGQESRVIILSTVRSNMKTIGFLNNMKRFNVAITRAKELLVVIGNEPALSRQVKLHWGKLIRYCKHMVVEIGS